MAVSTSTIQRTRSHRRAKYIHDPIPTSFITFNPVRYSDVSDENPPRHDHTQISPESQTTKSTFMNHQASLYPTEIAQACYTIDSAICTSNPETLSWRQLDEFAYLTSESLISCWENDLSVLCEQYLDAAFTPDALAKKLQAIMPAVRKLEDARDELRGVLDERVWLALDRRCAVLENAFEELDQRLAEMEMEEDC